ncbi:uncharacterized protein EAF01_002573 [Botrytis porri]|uniref:uncharacterized protein n=1 Tax=Botrytis porri TaxID=87229 RepID=UPI0018FF3480|nr:uncharacterized protein EAF01_002573 [Botrytis porri]KAF7911065.1 hypothetical protein EAF01_002573 [Botrytis porri]
MAKTIFTTITPLPPNISRQTVLDTLHDHLEMIDLNPSHAERTPTKPPSSATPEEYHCQWYRITDRIAYLPGNLYTGTVSFNACFHDLANGLQTHCYAPMGLDIKEKWTIQGNMPGEPAIPREIGINAPVEGLYIREDVEMKCNILMTRFVRKTLQECLKALVARLVVKAQLQEAHERNRRLTVGSASGYEREGDTMTPPLSPPLRSPGMASGGSVGRRGSAYSGLSVPTSPPLTPYNPEKWAEAGMKGHPALTPYTPLQLQQQQQQQQQLHQMHHDRKSYGGRDQRWSGISDKTQTSLPGPPNYANKPVNYTNKPTRISEMEAPPGPVELP